MVTPQEKAKRTRAKNAANKSKQAEELRRARASARKARSDLKSYKEGFKDGLNANK